MTEQNYMQYQDLILYTLPQCYNIDTETLEKSDLQKYLDKLHKNIANSTTTPRQTF